MIDKEVSKLLSLYNTALMRSCKYFNSVIVPVCPPPPRSDHNKSVMQENTFGLANFKSRFEEKNLIQE